MLNFIRGGSTQEGQYTDPTVYDGQRTSSSRFFLKTYD